MKKFILPWYGALITFILASMIILAYLGIYETSKQQTRTAIVCSFAGVDWNKENPRIKLKCGEKEYLSEDKNLMAWCLANPGKEIIADLNGNNNVIMKEKK